MLYWFYETGGNHCVAWCHPDDYPDHFRILFLSLETHYFSGSPSYYFGRSSSRTNFSALALFMLATLFFLHDSTSHFLTKHFLAMKRFLLIVAHLSLFGFFFPQLHRSLGQLAFGLLLFILFLSPLSKILRMRLLLQVMGLRRELGICMGYAAIVHGLSYLTNPLWFSLYIAPFWRSNPLTIWPPILFGLIAYFLTIPLLFTSNQWAQGLLGGKNWKLLHRLVYVLFFFAVLHFALIRGKNGVSDYWQIGLLLTAYALVKLLAWKNILPPFVWLIETIARRYQTYTVERKAELPS